ncbi:MAG: hypothetical protein HETSPECPRED_004745 [Heterodermia speciosa]|uniref:Uncharacterized protein n=1 Tax=Heterodermia speciosa TaxID=116794 RepID=A0A8H3I2E2_9LECA|nr:MAG: hypothetical protein HETSPECPRED_004745 [Heterodermia speciosa]
MSELAAVEEATKTDDENGHDDEDEDDDDDDDDDNEDEDGKEYPLLDGGGIDDKEYDVDVDATEEDRGVGVGVGSGMGFGVGVGVGEADGVELEMGSGMSELPGTCATECGAPPETLSEPLIPPSKTTKLAVAPFGTVTTQKFAPPAPSVLLPSISLT